MKLRGVTEKGQKPVIVKPKSSGLSKAIKARKAAKRAAAPELAEQVGAKRTKRRAAQKAFDARRFT